MISIERVDDQIVLRAPYHPSLPQKARSLGGRFSGVRDLHWLFDARDEQRVRDLAIAIYGTDGGPTTLVTLEVDLDHLQDGDSLWLAGREVAKRRFRDSAVVLGAGVVCIAGGFAGRGGSAKNPRVAAHAGTILEIRDVPRPIAEKELERYGDAVRITSEQPPASQPEIATEEVGPLAAYSSEELINELRRRGVAI